MSSEINYWKEMVLELIELKWEINDHIESDVTQILEELKDDEFAKPIILYYLD